MPTTPSLDDDNLHATGGANQTITAAGMEAWLDSVNAMSAAAKAKKRRMFEATELELIQTSRRSTT